ncbi:carbamoyltransferase HypF [Desulfoprunum benzoelyticum]|uniref:Carbamoyltransferase n=1 Tax=Desulfoprunum benzoelyticum TaxID=1506996 RepID=A0A840UXE1_9BACT|nr:hydrogenase maturation protein HypF [Desulfoprunum benzoelyticum]MBM9530275.1 carbamoyltransferase HypF [Desulfoprunum benzoelyticum]
MISLPIPRHRRIGVEILVRGIVQGVGFRPFIYNLACRFGISGTVTNTGDGVVIRAMARSDRLEMFVDALEHHPPPLARIVAIEQRPLTVPLPEGSFTILESTAGIAATTAIPPDIAICNDCRRELLDPGDRRYRYPFINCTNCGPRFTIVEAIPYDRPKTSMKVFPMCPECLQEYRDPGNRRFHAQPNACPVCGPRLFWHGRDGKMIACDDPITAAAAALQQGKIVALRGLGGFHLAVDATSPSTVATLRQRKDRPDKPLAVMLSDINTAEAHFQINDEERRLLLSPEHPIVLLRPRRQGRLAAGLAPGIDVIGIMLPYTPLHCLLFAEKPCPPALVMTSGNVSGAPICIANEDALQRLATIADYFLLHDREIVTRVDDSVCRVINGRSRLLRRARGYVPAPLTVPWPLPPTLGCGGGLKSTFCLGRDRSAVLSQHIGDLFNLEALTFYTESIRHLQRVFEITPEIVACDLHPDYLSTRYAEELSLPLYRIQHHHAHAVAVMAEHGISDPVLAIIMDGTGFGPDGTIWGGEFLRADLTSSTRLGRLSPLPLPGGDRAAIEPWRMAIAALYRLFGEDAFSPALLPPALAQIPADQRQAIVAMIRSSFNTPLTSSCGRLFDAVASLLGIRQYMSYEGQAAMELEALAAGSASSTWKNELLAAQSAALPRALVTEHEKMEICSEKFVKMIVHALHKGENPGKIALNFHFQLIRSITELTQRLVDQTGIHRVVLAGGCMQNRLLLEGLLHVFRHHELEVYTGEAVPLNDGAISLGQTIIGGLQHVSRDSHESD